MNASEVLGVRPGASPDELRLAWRRHCRRTHPDAGGEPEAFRRGVEAYRRLTGHVPPPVPVVVAPRLTPVRLARRWASRRQQRLHHPRVV